MRAMAASEQREARSARSQRAPGVRLYRVVADRIRAFILSERVPTGTRLMAERQLAAQLKVSRSALREGLVALEMEGVVKVAGGSGVYVCAAPGEPPESDDPSPRELRAARRLVLAQVAAMAARHATDATVHHVERILGAAEQSGSDRVPEREFMLALGAASGNSALLGVVDYLWGDQPIAATPASGSHRAMLEAIAERDEARAAKLASCWSD